MHEDLDQIARRDFLRWSGVTAAAASLSTLLPARTQAEEPQGERPAPAHPVILRSALLQVTLDATDALPFEYRSLATNSTLRGEDLGRGLTVTIGQRNPWRFFTAQLMNTYTKTPHSVAFHCSATDAGRPCASFVLRYELHDASLRITLEQIVEHPGYELIDVAMPRLVSARETDPGAWLVYGDSGGSFVSLAEAKSGTLPPNSFWGRIHSGMPVTMIGHRSLMCVQETTAFMDTTEVTISGASGSRRAAIGSGRVHRVNGGDCYNLNLGKGAPLNCGTQATPNLLVGQMPECRLDFLPVTGDPRSAWLQGGKLVRDRLPAIPKSFYHDTYIYGIRCDEPRFPQPSATFEQCGQLLEEVAQLTDNHPQIVHLWGWQFKGKDTGYPAVNVVDERIGGYDGMMQVMDRGRRHNATVTLSDNYDDAYRSSPAWNEAMIARRPDGGLWQSRAWTGEVSYIQGLAKYMTHGHGVERVRYTCERYNLPHTTHIDVLSYYAIRNDWDPQHPASGIRNLFEGRYRILQEFARHGVDVTSEGLRYPMIGHISCCWYAQTSETSPLGGQPIPLLPLVYGKSAIWGLAGGMRGESFDLRARHLFWGANLHDILRADVDRRQVTDVFYLIMVPWLHLHQREIQAFVRDGSRTATAYEGDTRTEIDWENKKYRVVLEGNDVATEESVFCPLDAGRLCFYSLRAQPLTAAWPPGWKSTEAAAVALSVGKRTAIPFHVEGDKVTVQTPERQPVILYRNRAQARI